MCCAMDKCNVCPTPYGTPDVNVIRPCLKHYTWPKNELLDVVFSIKATEHLNIENKLNICMRNESMIKTASTALKQQHRRDDDDDDDDN